MEPGALRFAPATERNREPILAVLSRVLPAAGLILEIASGSGQHAAYFAPGLPGRTWQPTDADPAALASIAAWREQMPCEGLLPPLALDVCEPRWPLEAAAAIVNINMIHISPWRACVSLLRGAARLLSPGQVLYLYGPFMRDGAHTAPSNASFDASLRAQNPAWGVRDLGAVTEVAQLAGFELDEIVEMPANNLSVVFRRR
jgi:hypothetical protein